MTSYRLELTKRMRTYIRRILDHVWDASPQGAVSLVGDINDSIERLKLTPHRAVVAGQPAGRADAVRSVSVGNHVVYFRVIDRTRTVRVLRVGHGARRPLRRCG